MLHRASAAANTRIQKGKRNFFTRFTGPSSPSRRTLRQSLRQSVAAVLLTRQSPRYRDDGCRGAICSPRRRRRRYGRTCCRCPYVVRLGRPVARMAGNARTMWSTDLRWSGNLNTTGAKKKRTDGTNCHGLGLLNPIASNTLVDDDQ